MKKIFKVLILILTLTVLTACFGEKDDTLDPGIKLYDAGGFDNFVEARKFFDNVAKEDPTNKKAKKWVSKIDKELSVHLRDRVTTLYNQHKLEEAFELVEIMISINPNDEEVIQAHERISADYKKQQEFDKFVSVMEENYSQIFKVFKSWNNYLEKVIVENGSPNSLYNGAVILLPEVSVIRERLQKNMLTLEEKSLSEAQNLFFQHLNKVEVELTDVITEKPENIIDYVKRLEGLTPASFNGVFVKIQDEVSAYLNELDENGEKKNNVEGRLNFEKMESSAKLDSLADEIE